MIFRVYGKVQGKARPRATTVNGHVGVYTPKATKKYEQSIAWAYQLAGGKLLDGEIGIHVRVFRKLPKSTPKRITEAPDVCKPDADNVLKVVLDALNGVAYHDDKAVTRMAIDKMPRTRIDEEYLEIEIYQKG